MKRQSESIKRIKKAIKEKKYKILGVKMESWGGPRFKHPNNTGGFVLKWVCLDIGFGELTFVHDKKEGLICETECMSRKFVDAVVKHFLDKSVKFIDR